MLLSNTAEGGSNGTTVSSANSGGTSGTAWDSVTVGASASLIFDTTHPSHGSLGYRFATGASSVQSDVVWSTAIGTAVASCWFRLYVFTPSSFANTPSILRMQGSGSQAVRFTWDSSGHILIRDGSGSNTTVATSSTALSTGTAYRIEGFCTVGASGTAEVKIWSSVDSNSTPTETLTAASHNFGSNNIDTFQIGQVAAATNIPQWWADDITINDSGYPGPAVVNPAPAEAAFTFAAGDPTVSTSSGASPTPAEGAWTVAAGAPTPAVGAVQQLTAAVSFAANNPTVTTSSAPGSKFLDQFIGGYGMQVLLGFGVDVTTDPAGWSLTDVTSDLYQPEPPQPAIGITFRGRADEQSISSPTACTFTLKNLAGNYTPRRRQGSHWPYMKIGLPCQILITTTSTHYERFSGYVDDIDPQWDETGNRAMVTFTAHGILQRLGNVNQPLHSALYRAITQTTPVTYWSMEDGQNAVSAANSVTGGHALAVTSGTVSFTGASGQAGSGPVIDFSSGGIMTGTVPAGTSSTAWRVEFSAIFNTVFDFAAPLQWKTNGDVNRWEVDVTDLIDGGLFIQYLAADGSSAQAVSNVAVDDSLWHRIRVDGSKSGSNIAITVTLDGTVVISHTFSSLAFGRITQMIANPNGSDSDAIPGIGQVAVWAPWSGSVDTFDAAAGHPGEDPVTRAARLCAENDVPFDADDTSEAAMGPQGVATLLTLLRECEAADGGVLDEVNFGLYLRTVNGRYNAPVAFTPTLQQIAMPWTPVENNLRTRNDVAVSRPGGSTVRYVQPTGDPYSPDGPGGVGSYPVESTVNVESDDDLIYYASQQVGLGTVNADRYPTMGINFAARTSLLASWLPLTVSSRMTVGGQYPTGASDNPDLIIEGWSEQLSKMVYAVQLNTSPSAPWIVGVLDGGFPLDTDGVTLHASWNGSAGSFQVDITAGQALLSTSGGDYPVDLNVDGQRVTVSACAGSSSPQTLTVSVASVNGVSMTHSAGASVTAWSPMILAL